jgi:hypothetical protein
MKKEYIVSQVEGEEVFYLSNMDDFDEKIECSDDEYWSSVEGQLFYEEEFRIEDDIAYPFINDIPDINFNSSGF